MQAAVGGAALEAARDMAERAVARGDATAVVVAERAEELGLVLLQLSVLAIVLTAPVGAIAIAVGGPRLLEQKGSGGDDEEVGGAAEIIAKCDSDGAREDGSTASSAERL